MKYRVGDIIKSTDFSGYYFVMDNVGVYLLHNLQNDYFNQYTWNIEAIDAGSELVSSILREEDV